MSEPIIVTLPHQLGKAEALRRLQASFSNAQSSGGACSSSNTSGRATTWIFARQAWGATPLVTLDAGQQGKGLGGKAGKADAGKAGQALQFAKLKDPDRAARAPYKSSSEARSYRC